ncbi:hypothetical protein D9M70_571160 [compost metagenome]
MLHDVCLGEGNDRAGLERDDCHVHVVAQIGRIDEARRRPLAVGARHRRRGDFGFIGEDGFRHRQAIDILIGLAHPMEANRRFASIANAPVAGRWDEGEAARLHLVCLAVERDGQFAFDDEDRALGSLVQFGLVAATARSDFHDIL